MDFENIENSPFNVILKENEKVIPYGSISYAQETFEIVGEYKDEVSLYRAKKFWKMAFADIFLLENNHDFKFKIKKDRTSSKFTLTCEFITACGRYAFWRINNNQNPEVKCVIETSHLPNIFQDYEEMINKPNPLLGLNEEIFSNIEKKANNVSNILKKIIKKISKNKDSKDEE